MAAFKDTESAEKAKLNHQSGKVGEPIDNGIIVVNDFVDGTFTVKSIVWNWSRFAEFGASSSSMMGSIELHDATGGSFANWFKKNVTDVLNCSGKNLTFALKTYFVGYSLLENSSDRDVPDLLGDVVPSFGKNPLNHAGRLGLQLLL